MTGVPENKLKDEFRKRRLNRLKALTNGEALFAMTQSVIKRDWLWYGTSFRSQNRIVAAKILSGILPTRINMSRGDPDQTKKLCRHCNKTAETDLHILNACPKTKDARSRRHNLVANKIAKELIQKDYCVWKEKTYQVNLERFKPAHKDGCCYFIEITCPYEKNSLHLQQREKEKEFKYRNLTMDHIRFDIDQNIEKTAIIAIAVGSAGTITKGTNDKLKKLGIGHTAKHLQMITMMESTTIWLTHSRS